ncbi:MAG TPA: trehalase family glycosidase [Oligoflexia bacterium]|nr:trehalase family glycosidase [Oligoflexia bacterium]HMP26887.1 trehalase family glycosidase [Oligoflexia bacterium]
MTTVLSPADLYPELFFEVQNYHLFSDSKTFVDAVLLRHPDLINAELATIKKRDREKILDFVKRNFDIPKEHEDYFCYHGRQSIISQIEFLWGTMVRRSRPQPLGYESGSLLYLPRPYLVPGGRFRECYYWDSYFTILGLEKSGRFDLIFNLIENFAYLLRKFGFIPNGNRSYYLSRSQPPFFSLMLRFLGTKMTAKEIFSVYGDALKIEYSYWTGFNFESLAYQPCERAVFFDKRLPPLVRYWDTKDTPREEGYFEDLNHAEPLKDQAARAQFFRDIRAACASGWDFSSRWFKDGMNFSTINTTCIAPIDLNCLIFNLERALLEMATLFKDQKLVDHFKRIKTDRIKTIRKLFWSEQAECFVDYNFSDPKQISGITAAACFPLFFKIATERQAQKSAITIEKKLLRDGGLLTTEVYSGQQWDAPNGWAPLQWIAVAGFENYGIFKLAETIALRWLKLNLKIFNSQGKLLEKYNVVDINSPAGGGEYPNQDGFGWTNGVFLALNSKYNLISEADSNKDTNVLSN